MFLFFIRVDEGKQMLYCHFLWDILLYANLLAVETNLIRTGTYIAIVGICHFSRPIYNTAHDTNLQALQMLGGFLDLGNGFAKVVERTATTRTTDILVHPLRLKIVKVDSMLMFIVVIGMSGRVLFENT